MFSQGRLEQPLLWPPHREGRNTLASLSALQSTAMPVRKVQLTAGCQGTLGNTACWSQSLHDTKQTKGKVRTGFKSEAAETWHKENEDKQRITDDSKFLTSECEEVSLSEMGNMEEVAV